MYFLLFSLLTFADPVEEQDSDNEDQNSEEQSGQTETSEEKPEGRKTSETSTEDESKAPTSDSEKQSQEDNDSTETTQEEEVSQTRIDLNVSIGSNKSKTEDRFRPVLQLDGMAMVMPSFEIGGGLDTVPTFTSGFMMNVGIGTRLWEGQAKSGVPMREYVKTATPMFELTSGFHVAYEQGRERLGESYALSMGGYLAFYDIEESSESSESSSESIMSVIANASNGVALGLSKRRSLDDELVEVPCVDRQWQFEVTTSQEFEFLQIYQFTSIGFGNEALPWRFTYGIGGGAAF
jgi:hypothetical protein